MRTSALLLLMIVAASGEPYFTEPSVCPTRPEIAFVSGGDIWTVSAKGGEAHLLVSHPADESRPLYSPDGTQLAFVSTRTGNGDIYVLTLSTGALKRLTFDDGLDQLDAWSRDGRWLYFSTGSHDVNRKNDIYRVSVEGGTPMPVSADRFTNEFEAAPAPDGITLAFAARGISDQQWWRQGHSHLDESEIWLRKEGSPASYERVVQLNGRNVWPMWTPDGRQLYFMSDRTGHQNIWTLPLGGKAKQVTKFTAGRVLWPSIAYDGKAIVFEHDFKIWQLDTKSGEAYRIPITLVGSAAGPGVTHMTLSQFTDLRLSPDGKKIAVVAHGHVFAAPAKEGGHAVRATATPGVESQVEWAPDSNRIVYLSQRDAITHVFVYDFTKHTETQITRGPLSDESPRFSPDGKSIAFLRDLRELRVAELDGQQERLLASGFIGGGFGPANAFSWSLDGKWIAYASDGEQGLRNVHVVPLSGGAGRQIGFLANASANSIEWSPDGKYLLYVTGQRTEMPAVARIDLTPQQPKFGEEKFEDLFKPEEPKEPKSAHESKGAAKAVDIDFDGIRERISMLPIGLAVSNPQISPDGKSLLFSAAVGGQTNLYLYPLEETDRTEPRVAKQLTSTSGAKRSAQFSPDSKEVYFLEAGKPQTINIENRQIKPVAVTAELDVNFDEEKMAVFEQAWAGQRDGFYDPQFHGVDWDDVRRTYAPLLQDARTPDEMRRLLRLMIGELNSSHSGVSAASNGPPHPVVGQLGLTFDSREYERSGKLLVTEVLPHSPADIAKIHAGDQLTAVDGVPLGAHVNLDELLQYKVDKRVMLDVGGKQITVRPVGSLADLIYRKWVEDNRAYVARISNGKLGYVHIRDMSEQALTQLYLDLDSENREKQGVVVDIRNNNGGFVNAYALDVLSRRPYLTMTMRRGPASAARTQLGQRSLELPTILVVNQHSLSDAEDFTEGYRTLKLGKVVGEPTAGWIIYTGGMDLIDGSSMRMPGIKITGADGKEMENNPRPVDIAVSRPIGESYTGRDSQLDAAVKELLLETDKKN